MVDETGQFGDGARRSVMDPDPRRAVGVILEGFQGAPSSVPLLAVDVAPDPELTQDALADLFRSGFAPVRTFDGQVYPALHSWSVRYGHDAAQRHWWVTLLREQAPVITCTLEATSEWASLVGHLGLVVLAIGDLGLVELEHPDVQVTPEAYATRLQARVEQGLILGATIDARNAG